MSLATEDVVFYAIIAFIVIENSIEIYLSRRQVSCSSTSKLLDKVFFWTTNNKNVHWVCVRACDCQINFLSYLLLITSWKYVDKFFILRLILCVKWQYLSHNLNRRKIASNFMTHSVFSAYVYNVHRVHVFYLFVFLASLF